MAAYYDRQGFPIDLGEYAKLFNDEGYRKVAYNKVGLVSISTVWLGLNHNFHDGCPLIFETLVSKVDWADEQMYRYPSEKAALHGHNICIYKAWVLQHEGMELDFIEGDSVWLR